MATHAQVERAILNVLVASPRACSLKVIAGLIPAELNEDLPHADITAALRRLQDKHQVNGTNTEDFGTLWKETPDGRLRVA